MFFNTLQRYAFKHSIILQRKIRRNLLIIKKNRKYSNYNLELIKSSILHISNHCNEIKLIVL